MPAKLINLIGQKFGRLTVVSRAENNSNNSAALWVCSCSCGGNQVATGTRLKRGDVKSCGCLKRENPANRSHGHAGNTWSATYSSWHGMRTRCLNEKSVPYKYYGGRGIGICERWHDFSNFLNDMGEKPVVGWHIDRINPDRDYEPSNCEWVPASENARRRNAYRRNQKKLADKRP